MKKQMAYLISLLCLGLLFSCEQNKRPYQFDKEEKKNTTMQRNLTAEQILSNPDYLAISYGGYRKETRDIQPTIDELKEDLKIIHAMGIKILRTYNVRLPHASNVLKAIHQLKQEDDKFEMYVMLGAWIDCKNAWTDLPINHFEESEENASEIERAVELAKEYQDIVKIIAVGNEAMVKWAAAYYVQPKTILKWVKYLQNLKSAGDLNQDLWITSSDNFASWGGGDAQYHTEDLNQLIAEVDYLSIHTYPMHDTHYNPIFWGTSADEAKLGNLKKLDLAMSRSLNYAVSQYDSVVNYMKSLHIEKPVHIGETGWASVSSGLYGAKGSKATDEYKQALYYQKMRTWSKENKVACFYFQAFDEPWKDPHNPSGSENFFGLFTVEGKAKYALWNQVDQGVFNSLKRGENPVQKTYNGKLENLLLEVDMPPVRKEMNVNH